MAKSCMNLNSLRLFRIDLWPIMKFVDFLYIFKIKFVEGIMILELALFSQWQKTMVFYVICIWFMSAFLR